MVLNILRILLLAVLPGLGAAEPIQLSPNPPGQYTVKEGDTLWDIAGQFLKYPWQWPDLWRQNRQIQNPHLIYPGDTIYLSVVNGVPQLSLSRTGNVAPPGGGPFETGPCVMEEQDTTPGRSHFPIGEDGRVLPCIRLSPLKQAVEMIPMERIQAFLSSPKVVGRDDMAQAPYIVSAVGGRLLAGPGDKVYARPALPAEQASYTIYRAGGAYKRPGTGEILGYEADYVADAVLQQSGDPSTLAIVKSDDIIRTGDRLMPTTPETFTLHFFPRPPDKPLTGSIISVIGGVTQIGRHNIVVIDRGTDDGLQTGHQLEILRRGAVITDHFAPRNAQSIKLPDELAGVLMVFRPFQRVSYALVMKASQAIHVLDIVRTP